MSVILRCPHCGTSRGTPGECDACHEAEVRYFCTNHTPGLWLERPACAQCGARFGEAAAPAPAAPPPAPRGPTFGRVPPPPPPSGDAVFGRHGESARRPPTSIEDVLAEVARARPATPPPGPRPRPIEIDPRVAVRGMGGCLVRAVVMLVVFVVMIFASMFMFAGSMFRIW